MKRTIPLLITFVSGMILAISYFIPILGELGDIATVHFDILAAIAFILGGGNLLRNHGEIIYKKHAGWGYSAIAVGTFLVTLVFGLGKIGVQAPPPGMWTAGLIESGQTVALVAVETSYEGTQASFDLSATVRKAEPGQTLPISVDGQEVGTITIAKDGKGDLVIKADTEAGKDIQPVLAKAYEADGAAITIGSSLTGRLVRYAAITGSHIANGGMFWWMYEYSFKPLQQTTFAMLAFYVASAAFRAFRAKNVESVLLLGTAFVILLGRTYFGTLLTGWLPDEGFLSFFQIPNLTGWIMSVWNTAGNRAIMIGIALGIAATSLKVILGVDRSYLGSSD